MNPKIKHKVIFAISSLAGGGAERLYVNLARQMEKRGLSVLCLLGRGRRAYDLSGRVRVLAVSGQDPCARIARIQTILQRESPVTVFSFLPQMNLEMIFAAMGLRGVRLIVTQHTTLSSLSGGDLEIKELKLATERFYPLADLVVAVSEGVRNDLRAQCGLSSHKVRVVYNGVDIGQIRALAKEKVTEHPWFNDRTPLIVHIGSLRPQKDQKFLLRAFALLRRNADCRLAIIGDGPLAKELKAESRKAGIGNAVCFLGFQKNPFKFLKRASAFVLSSVCEGFPTVILEAMAVGTPVISTDCQSGPREIIRNGSTGLLVPLGDREALMKRMMLVLKDKRLAKKLASNARNYVRRFNIGKTADQYFSLLR
jgi:glycosyltransferase involved in cell wall biosynthesis